jgi:hypothetical protein
MNTATQSDIRKQAKRGIDSADDTTVRMILAMLDVKKNEMNQLGDFEQEIERRFEEYEKGNIVPLSLAELEKRVLNNHQKQRNSTGK